MGLPMGHEELEIEFEKEKEKEKEKAEAEKLDEVKIEAAKIESPRLDPHDRSPGHEKEQRGGTPPGEGREMELSRLAITQKYLPAQPYMKKNFEELGIPDGRRMDDLCFTVALEIENRGEDYIKVFGKKPRLLSICLWAFEMEPLPQKTQKNFLEWYLEEVERAKSQKIEIPSVEERKRKSSPSAFAKKYLALHDLEMSHEFLRLGVFADAKIEKLSRTVVREIDTMPEEDKKKFVENASMLLRGICRWAIEMSQEGVAQKNYVEWIIELRAKKEASLPREARLKNENVPSRHLPKREIKNNPLQFDIPVRHSHVKNILEAFGVVGDRVNDLWHDAMTGYEIWNEYFEKETGEKIPIEKLCRWVLAMESVPQRARKSFLDWHRDGFQQEPGTQKIDDAPDERAEEIKIEDAPVDKIDTPLDHEPDERHLDIEPPTRELPSLAESFHKKLSLRMERGEKFDRTVPPAVLPRCSRPITYDELHHRKEYADLAKRTKVEYAKIKELILEELDDMDKTTPPHVGGEMILKFLSEVAADRSQSNYNTIKSRLPILFPNAWEEAKDYVPPYSYFEKIKIENGETLPIVPARTNELDREMVKQIEAKLKPEYSTAYSLEDFSGCRTSELPGAKIIFKNDAQVSVFIKATKRSEDRTVFITESSSPKLFRFLQKFKSGSRPFKKLNTESYRKANLLVRKKLGLRGEELRLYSPHSLRHQKIRDERKASKEIGEDGKKPPKMSKWHKDRRSTMGYGQENPE